jgi:hypothetical protein
VVAGNRVRTPAELLLVPMAGWRLSRTPDEATGCPELAIRATGGADDPPGA